MTLFPSVYQLEKALKLYQEESSSKTIKQWYKIPWIYDHLSLSARVLSCFGAARCIWWKKAYILPILCEKAEPFLRQFKEGTYSKMDGYVFSELFHFFSSNSKDSSQFFDEEIRSFLTEKNPFSPKKEIEEKQPFSKKEARLEKAPILYKKTSREQIEEDACKENRRVDWEKMLSEVNVLYEQLLHLFQEFLLCLLEARPFRKENPDLYKRLMQMKEALEEMLGALEINFPSTTTIIESTDAISFKALILKQKEALRCIRNNIKSIEEALSFEKIQVLKEKEAFSDLCKSLTKQLDSVPLLSSEKTYRSVQARAIKEAREYVKFIRKEFQKNMDLDISLSDFQKNIIDLLTFARRCYDEAAVFQNRSSLS